MLVTTLIHAWTCVYTYNIMICTSCIFTAKIELLFLQRPLSCELHIYIPVHTSLPCTTQSQHFLIMWPTVLPKIAVMITFAADTQYRLHGPATNVTKVYNHLTMIQCNMCKTWFALASSSLMLTLSSQSLTYVDILHLCHFSQTLSENPWLSLYQGRNKVQFATLSMHAQRGLQ